MAREKTQSNRQKITMAHTLMPRSYTSFSVAHKRLPPLVAAPLACVEVDRVGQVDPLEYSSTHHWARCTRSQCRSTLSKSSIIAALWSRQNVRFFVELAYPRK